MTFSKVQLKRIARLAYGDSLTSSVREEGQYSVFGSNGPVGTHTIPNTKEPVIVIGRKGSFGAINWSPNPVYAIDTTYYVDPTLTSANIRWLYYALLIAKLDAFSQDTGVPGLNRESAYKTEIPCPSLHKQTEIAKFLDLETVRIDQLVEKKQQLIELLEEKRTALISHTVTKGLDPTVTMKDSGIPWLGDIPTHWRSMPLSRLSYQITNGYVGPTRDILVPEGIAYIQSLHIKDGYIHHGEDYFVSREWHLQHDRTRLREGDVLLVQTGDIGQSAVVGPDIAGSNCHALIIIRLKPEVAYSWFVGYLLRSEGGRGAVLATRTGATHPHLNVGYVREVQFPKPPLEEQRDIVDFLDTQVRASDQIMEKLRTQIGKLIEYRQALITAAVTGQIDVTGYALDPEEVVA